MLKKANHVKSINKKFNFDYNFVIIKPKLNFDYDFAIHVYFELVVIILARNMHHGNFQDLKLMKLSMEHLII